MSAALAYHFDDDDYLGTANDNVARPSRFTVIEGQCPLQPLRVYDAAGRLVHVDEVGGGETDYLHGVGQTLARIKDGEFTYLHPDHLGSPQVGTNESGAVAFNEYYTPFGEALVNAAVNDNQSGFTGHIKDKSTGLNYMQARYYDPNIGRFLSVDPVGFLDTGNPGYFNRYSYTMNNPINMIDPDGMYATPTNEGARTIDIEEVERQYQEDRQNGTDEYEQYAENNAANGSDGNSAETCSIAPSCIVEKDDNPQSLGYHFGGVGYEEYTQERPFWFDKKVKRKILSYTCTDSCGNESTALSYGVGKQGFGVQTRKNSGQYINSKGQLEHRQGAPWPTGARNFSPTNEFLGIHNKNYQTCSEYPGCE